MIGPFGTKLGSSIAQRLLLRSLPALAFWSLGVAAWLDHRGFKEGWDSVTQWIRAQPADVSALFLVAAAVAVAASGAIVGLLTLPSLRIAEGYWPKALARPAQALRRRQERRLDDMELRFAALAQRVAKEKATPEERVELLRLDSRLRNLPPRGSLMPTAVGNALRSGERWPSEKWGIDVVKCWPQLWLAMPDERRKEIDSARATLDETARALAWAAVAVVWGSLAWWAVPAAFGAASAAYFHLVGEARRYALLVEAAADTHYGTLVAAVGWTMAADGEAVRSQGSALTEFLWHGTPAPKARPPDVEASDES